MCRGTMHAWMTLEMKANLHSLRRCHVSKQPKLVNAGWVDAQKCEKQGNLAPQVKYNSLWKGILEHRGVKLNVCFEVFGVYALNFLNKHPAQ